MERRVDFLVVGSGLAGLSYALKVAPYGKVCVLCKTKVEETNTSYAQGGIAAVMDGLDSFEQHVSDTLIAGAGLCKKNVVEMVVKEAPKQINELLKWGANFDQKEDGDFDLHREGGHSAHRILHHKDNTGFEIQRILTEQARKHENIELLEEYFAVDIITQHHLGETVTRYDDDIECYGVYALDINEGIVEKILARTTYMATGGIGNVYQTTTNPVIATGDGIAMAYRAKCIIDNMEFVQFHPTSLYNPNERPSFLITEAMRGYGAVLKTPDGNEFMLKYDERGSLAPRDIVARAIDSEMKAGGLDFVHLDATHLDGEGLKAHFPNIYSKCLEIGIDITKQPIPVTPAAHYACGGIRVDLNGQTSIHRLFAGGEDSSSGLHGANRLASNSLLEAIVYSERASKKTIETFKNIAIKESVPEWNDEGTTRPEELVLITQEMRELQQIMTNYVGIVRSNLRLNRALDRLEIIYRETEELFEKSKLSPRICELRNAINIAYLIIKMARRRNESLGLHYNIDCPKRTIKVNP